MNETTEAAAATPPNEWEWAIVEIFGHRRHVGRTREEERFGSKLLRIDVPKHEGAEIKWSSHYYGGASIFSFTPTDEKTVMNYAERSYTPAIPYRDHGADDVDEDDEFDFGGDDDGERDGTTGAGVAGGEGTPVRGEPAGLGGNAPAAGGEDTADGGRQAEAQGQEGG